MAGKTENMKPTWKILMKHVDLEEPTSFLDHVYSGCTQRECHFSKDIVTNHRNMLESRISLGGKEKLPARTSGKCDAEIMSSWSYDMEGHTKKFVERYCELSIKNTNSQHHAWITVNLKKKMSQLVNCLQSAPKMFSNVCIWLVLGVLTFYVM